VNQAIQEKERAVNEAWADYNQSVPRAKGEAEQLVRSAEGYALERENHALGDASRFEALYDEYRRAPEVTRKRMYFETMGDLMGSLERKVIVDEKARGVRSRP
jgi:membrane protease subunit HflK